MKEKRKVILVVILSLIIGFFLGDKYAQYQLHCQAVEYQKLQQQAEIASKEKEEKAIEISSKGVTENTEDASLNVVTDEKSIKEQTTTSTQNVEKKNENRAEQTEMINLNTADKHTLMQLTGIGEVKAEAILAYRAQQGKFYSIEELMNVKGIGEKTFEKNKKRLCVE